MKIFQSSLLLLAILGMTSLGCGQPAAPPATEAPAAPAATENASEAEGSADKAAPAAEETKEDAGSEKKEG